MYGIIYGVKRTTIYLTHEMKAGIEGEALRLGVTEAEVIRRSVGEHLETQEVPRPRLPLFEEPLGFDLAGRVDELLESLGERR